MSNKILMSLAIVIIFFISIPLCSSETLEHPSVNRLRQKGFVSCIDDHSTTVNFIDDKSAAGFLNLWNQMKPNSHIATTMLSKQYPDGESFATVSTSPTIEGGCDTTFIQIIAFKETCPKLRETTFKEWKFFENIGNTPVYEAPTSPNVTVTLIPVENSCMIIKNGSLFYPKKDVSSQVTPPKNVQAGELE